MPLITVQIFGKLVKALGIKEAVALTKLDLTRAIPVFDLDRIVRSELVDIRVFQFIEGVGGAGVVALDPRIITNWDAIVVNGIETGGTVVPADHDFLIVAGGADSTVTQDIAYFRRVTTSIGDSEQMLFFWNTPLDQVMFNSAGPVKQNLHEAYFDRPTDPGTYFISIAAASTVGLTLTVLSAPPGILT